MSAKDLVGKEFWSSVAQALKGDALSWWKEHESEIVETAREEAKQVFTWLKRGDTSEAKYVIAMHMMQDDREAWKAYRDGTTDKLTGIAKRRAAMMDALEALGKAAAETIGKAAMGALGI